MRKTKSKPKSKRRKKSAQNTINAITNANVQVGREERRRGGHHVYFVVGTCCSLCVAVV